MRGLDQNSQSLAPEGPQSPFDAVMLAQDNDIEGMVRRALAKDRVQLAFQPIVLSHNPSQVSFYESWIRLLDDAGRLLPARLFFPAVADSELGREIDCCSMRMGLAKLRDTPNLRLAINMSARSLADWKWRTVLFGALRETEGLGHRLILEISEDSAMLLPEIVIRFMEELQPYGVTFSLDHFGSGHIAFGLLKDFMFDLAKIDRQYTRDIDTNPDNQVLAEALNTVAHQFEMFTVSEGVETAPEAAVISQIGIDCMQGYYFGQPKATL